MRVEKSGRILLPLAIRRKLGLKEGESDLLLEVADRQPVVVTTRAQALERAQTVLSTYVKPGRLISEELIAGRREEVRRDLET